jgi:membrane protein required for colicin V production
LRPSLRLRLSRHYNSLYMNVLLSTQLNVLDFIILAVLVTGFVMGLIKGVIKQAFALGGLLCGLIIGSLLYKPFAVFLQNVVKMSDNVAQVVAFILILIAVPIAFVILGTLFSRLVKVAKLEFIDRLGGGLFGLMKYFLIMGLFFQLLEISGFSDKVIRSGEGKTSVLYQPVYETSNKCLRWAWKKMSSVKDNFTTKDDVNLKKT